MSLQRAQFRSFLWLRNIPVYNVPHPLYLFLCSWAFRGTDKGDVTVTSYYLLSFQDSGVLNLELQDHCVPTVTSLTPGAPAGCLEAEEASKNRMKTES